MNKLEILKTLQTLASKAKYGKINPGEVYAYADKHNVEYIKYSPSRGCIYASVIFYFVDLDIALVVDDVWCTGYGGTHLREKDRIYGEFPRKWLYE